MLDINPDYVLKILKKLLLTPSPSGYTDQIMKLVMEEAGKLGLEMRRTNKGGGFLTIAGSNPDYCIGLSAHVDTLGAMVRSVQDNGFVRFTPIGGYMMGSVENEYCRIHTRSGQAYDGTILTTHPSVHVYRDAKEWKREEKNMEIRIDEAVRSKDDVESLGVRTGDPISFDPRMKVYENGFVKSRHLDDKAGAAAVFGLLEALKRSGRTPKTSLSVYISTYEEVGHGASFVPGPLNELIAVDMGAMGDDLNASEQAVSICAKDSSGPYDYGMTSRLIELAEREDIAFVTDIYPHYGSDASAALRGGMDIRAALIGPAVHASHSMERTHLQSVIGTAQLMAAYIEQPAPAY